MWHRQEMTIKKSVALLSKCKWNRVYHTNTEILAHLHLKVEMGKYVKATLAVWFYLANLKQNLIELSEMMILELEFCGRFFLGGVVNDYVFLTVLGVQLNFRCIFLGVYDYVYLTVLGVKSNFTQHLSAQHISIFKKSSRWNTVKLRSQARNFSSKEIL